MGRKKKVDLTLEEKLQEVQGEITKAEENLKMLRQKRKDIEKEIADRDKEMLYQVVKQSGKSMEEILGLLEDGIRKSNKSVV